MSIADSLENKILDLVFNGIAYGGQATVYAKLHIGDPGEAATANPAGNTTRAAVTFGAASAGVVTSDTDAAWTNVSTSETYSHISLWDALTGGNPLWSGPMSASKAVSAGDDFTIPAGDLTVSLD